MRATAAALFALLAACASSEVTSHDVASEPVGKRVQPEGDVVGTAPPAWNVRGWINSPPLTLAELRGKVVLVRWFMSPSCPMCSGSAEALNTLDRDYRERGLVVIGMYHHKDDEPLDDARVAGYVSDYGFAFPVAIDPEWRTLRRWWLDGHDRAFTSVSFLIDRQGVIRHVHPGGVIDLAAPDGQALKSAIDQLL